MIKLYPHQKEALDQTEGFKNIAVYHDMGLGKTFTGSEMMKRFGCTVNLIVCQKSKLQDWIDHFNEYYATDERSEFQKDLIFDLTNKKAFQAFINEAQQATEDNWIQDELTGEYYRQENLYPFNVVGVINYELAWRRKQLLQLQDFTLMLDESSMIQNTSAKQTKFILKLKPRHVILLSGTPVGGKYENLWTQCHLLGWGISEKLYLNQYVNWTTIFAGGITHKIVDKENPYKNIERLKSKMREYGAVFKKTEEVIDLPDQVFTNVVVKAPKEYWKFRKDSIITVEDVELVGDTSLTKLLYARQLCGQYCKTKLDAFKDLLNSTQDKLIVFYNFNDELEKLKMICQELDRQTSEVNGHLKDLTSFKDCDNAVCLCQYQSASKGLNLQEYGCNKIVYFTLPLSSEDFEQSKKRIHRIGQTKTCFYYVMLCRGTVEEQILHTLEDRKDFTDELFK